MNPSQVADSSQLERLRELSKQARAVVEPTGTRQDVAQPLLTVYVSIGNSDDKLSQAQWSTYCQVVNIRVRRFADVIYGVWYSLSNDAWQNACWAFRIRESEAVKLKNRLQDACMDFGQDSIAWAVASTEFIRPMV